MIKINKTDMDISGSSFVVGAELTQVIGAIYDDMKENLSEKAARDFIQICVKAAIDAPLKKDEHGVSSKLAEILLRYLLEED